jgi:hypothetical protein
MSNSTSKARMVRARTREVVAYHRNAEQPGKPLHLLVPGGLIALAALSLIVVIAYRVWYEASLAQDTGVTLMLVLAPFYVGGVFLFSYGYELYNLPAAIRLTAIIVFVTVAAVVILAVLVVLLGNLGKSGSSSDSGSSSSGKVSSSAGRAGGSASSSGGGGIAGAAAEGVGRVIGGAASMVSPIHTHTTEVVTHEVVREVPVAPPAPKPIACPFCGRNYIPAETKYLCPSCGAATPDSLLSDTDAGS